MADDYGSHLGRVVGAGAGLSGLSGLPRAGSGSKAKSVFWVGANILFDTQTGATNQVLMLVHREQDATAFDQERASVFLNFVRPRADRISSGIIWDIVKSETIPGRWVIKGEQDVP